MFFLTTRMSYTRYRKIMLIKKHTCQTFTNEKHWAYNFEGKSIKIKRKLWVKQIILKENSKPEFAVLIIISWNHLITGIFSSNFIEL